MNRYIPYNKFLLKFCRIWFLLELCLLRRTKIKKIEGRIPDKGPLLVAAHHEENADVGVLYLISRRYLYWVASQRFFGKNVMGINVLKYLYNKLGVILVDRVSHERNKYVFDYVLSILKDNAAVVFFPEGNLRSERGGKKLGKAKSGVIKTAKLAKEKGLDVPIYPIGLEYKKNKGFSEVIVRIGTPFFVKEKESTGQSLKMLMKEITRLSGIKVKC